MTGIVQKVLMKCSVQRNIEADFRNTRKEGFRMGIRITAQVLDVMRPGIEEGLNA